MLKKKKKKVGLATKQTKKTISATLVTPKFNTAARNILFSLTTSSIKIDVYIVS